MTATYVPTYSEYIIHHLKHLSTRHQDKIIDFSILNLDTIFWSILCGVIACSCMYIAARKTVTNIPGRFLALIEIIVEIVDNQSKTIIHSDRAFIAPLALTILVWIALMNSLDFLPVDFMWSIARLFDFKETHHRIVPTADLNNTLGISLGVLTMVLYYNFKTKGVNNFIFELFIKPFGIWFIPFNLLLNAIEFIAKILSLGMRLFGNIYAGELLFLLIALLGSVATTYNFIGHVIIGSIWAIFHILIVLLQAFIFMMLTLVYFGQAHEAH